MANSKEPRGFDFRLLLWGLLPLGAVLGLFGAGVWSWFISPVHVPLGSHTLGFGRSYTVKRRPPAWYRPRRMSAAILRGTARGRIFRMSGNTYFIGWQ